MRYCAVVLARFLTSFAMLCGVVLFAKAEDAVPFAGTGEIKLESPNITGTGPWAVVVKGTLSIDKDTTGFVGTKAMVKGTLFTYDASVSLPKGNPEPGKGSVPVEYTWSSMPNKGTFKGDAVLEFKDSN